MRLSGGASDQITLDVPSAANTPAIDAVVAAHDPAPHVAARQARQAAAALAADNEVTLRDQADQAIDTLQAAWNNWATLTPAQKDAALKLELRVTVVLARIVLRKLDTL